MKSSKPWRRSLASALRLIAAFADRLAWISAKASGVKCSYVHLATLLAIARTSTCGSGLVKQFRASAFSSTIACQRSAPGQPALMIVLYDHGHPFSATFESYLKDRWGMTANAAGRLMACAQLVDKCVPIGIDLSTSKAGQVRELLRLDSPKEVAEVWEEVSAEGKPTAKRIKAEAPERVKDIIAGRDTVSGVER